MSRVLIVEPYGSDSHRAWAEGLATHLDHDVRTIIDRPQRWRWALRYGAVALAQQIDRLCADGWVPEVAIISGMVHTSALVGLARDSLRNARIVSYFHETQLRYPDFDVAGRQRVASDEFALVNASSMAVSDVSVFNSAYHRDEAMAGLVRLFSDKPDAAPSVATRVLSIGIDVAPRAPQTSSNELPLIVWNHRWDHDKNPQGFFRALEAVEHLSWRLAVVGDNERIDPQEFNMARERFADRIEHWGYLERASYVAVSYTHLTLPTKA